MSGSGFLGRGWGFPVTFGVGDAGLCMVEDEQDIRESLHILFGTRPGERIMQPDFGCRLNALVFETADVRTFRDMEEAVDRAVLFWEPRIRLDKVSAVLDPEREGVVLIALDYTIRRTNTRTNMVYPFYFLEGTDLPGRTP